MAFDAMLAQNRADFGFEKNLLLRRIVTPNGGDAQKNGDAKENGDAKKVCASEDEKTDVNHVSTNHVMQLMFLANNPV
jgi:hypothetical protein